MVNTWMMHRCIWCWLVFAGVLLTFSRVKRVSDRYVKPTSIQARSSESKKEDSCVGTMEMLVTKELMSSSYVWAFKWGGSQVASTFILILK